MGKLYVEREETFIPTELHKKLGAKADKVITELFNELIDEGLDAVEAKYVIDYSTMNASLNTLLNLK